MDSKAFKALSESFGNMAGQLEQQNALLGQILEDAHALRETVKKIHWEAERARNYQDTLQRVALSGYMEEIRQAMRSHQLGYLRTLETIRAKNLSFARFGDGELQLMTRTSYRLRFQRNSAELQNALEEVLATPVPNLLLGMPNLFNDMHWRWVWADIWPSVRPYFADGATFGNSHVCRPVFFQAYGELGVKAWASVWEGKSALVITGEGSRFDMVPALFSGLTSVETLHSLPEDAFVDLDRVLERARESTADVVLISLGPTGTLLAHKLAQEGRQALDIGHLSSSYLNAMEGGAFPEAMPVARLVR
ncbi:MULTISPECIES: GT-D fold domain-containing glycosyltransferase [unclassified Arthrobacter]|uniref:GT-D fold domain-containing glycosyltransferase n=1 Tax=unclassified Arthrobacter TaxID=235627 RepID=UPI001E5C1744|nr:MULTISPECIES: GT-D fold domain-containing glycosyltransferase [unclassified Arthrobacter]MCC9145759.1 GT-D fold domain-containing protein [Arthrobacter sp. zg-Y919]MDK1276988.1 GT-D fold domain-containing glycosyltransferase [Arthrobacter sp. zg.Y919]WIB04084.1 GT-D fold domain-containing glycosyltransferase [Arthrobacter sp. zg-Y919]